ncbi:MAG: hypothetical protein LWY06_15900 [Firmicutes bacterium]|nr:hypothetical protein [Bacillota bacterium]
MKEQQKQFNPFLFLFYISFFLLLSGCGKSDYSVADNEITVSSTGFKTEKSQQKKYIYAAPLDNFQYVSEEDQKRTFESGPDFIAHQRSITAEMITEKMGVKKGQSFADIGSGDGYFVFPMSEAVGAEGKLYSIEMNQACLLYQMQLQRSMVSHYPGRFNNIIFRLDSVNNLLMPENSLDHAILVGVHNYFFADPDLINNLASKNRNFDMKTIEISAVYTQQKELTASIKYAMKPGAKLGLIEPFINETGSAAKPRNPKVAHVTLVKDQVITLMTKHFGFKFSDYVKTDDYEFYIFENQK